MERDSEPHDIIPTSSKRKRYFWRGEGYWLIIRQLVYKQCNGHIFQGIFHLMKIKFKKNPRRRRKVCAKNNKRSETIWEYKQCLVCITHFILFWNISFKIVNKQNLLYIYIYICTTSVYKQNYWNTYKKNCTEICTKETCINKRYTELRTTNKYRNLWR